jgi:hypothetical protein
MTARSPGPRGAPDDHRPSPSLAARPFVGDGPPTRCSRCNPCPARGQSRPPQRPMCVGAFRMTCQAGQVLADDPVVYPGQPGKSHLHQFYGNESADAFSTYLSLSAQRERALQPRRGASREPLGLLDAGDARRERAGGKAQIRLDLLQAPPLTIPSAAGSTACPTRWASASRSPTRCASSSAMTC